MDTSNSRKKSLIWNSFTEIGPGSAKCNFCSAVVKYAGGSTGNLSRHLRTKHPLPTVELARQEPEITFVGPSGVDRGNIIAMKKRTSIVWRYFTFENDQTRANCNLCNKQLAYTPSTMSNLGRHLKRRHPETNIESNMSINEESEKESIEVYSVQNVEEVSSADGMKTYEIAMKGFEEMEQDVDQSLNDPSDPDWEPRSEEEGWRVQTISILEAGPKEKKANRRSRIWDHFEKASDNKSGTCLLCGKLIKLGTISNLGRHLRNKHPTVLIIRDTDSTNTPNSSFRHNEGEPPNQDDQVLLRNEVDISTEMIEVSVDDMQKPTSIVETKTNDSPCVRQLSQTDELNCVSTTQASQTETINDYDDFNMHDFIKPKQKTVFVDQVDQQLVKMVVKGCYNVTIVEQPSFKDFVRLLNPKYQLPSINKIAQELIPQCYRECEKRACRSLQTAEGVCLYIDQWKSRANNYMCVSAHFINAECKFESIFLSCHVLSMTENVVDVSERLQETASDWEISEKIVAVVTDNTDIMSTGAKLTPWPHAPHFIRSLSIVIHEGLQTIKSLVGKVKTLILDLTKSPDVLAKIYSTHKSLKLAPVKLITKVSNEWSSSFTTVEMLSRIVKLNKAICHVQQDLVGLKLMESEWRLLKAVVNVLEPFKIVKKEIMNEKRVTMSKVVFYIRALKRQLKAFQNTSVIPHDATYIATVTETSLTKHFSDLEVNDFVANVLLLDPRLKKCVFEDESEFAYACSKLKKEVCDVVLLEPQYREPNPNSIWNSFDSEVKKLNSIKDPIGKGILELENYLQEQLVGRDEDPLLWWKERSAIYPRLYKLAKKYLCITATSVNRESISFKTAYMLSQLKHNDSSPSESEMMFLHHNM